jgi:hypothetical protein
MKNVLLLSIFLVITASAWGQTDEFVQEIRIEQGKTCYISPEIPTIKFWDVTLNETVWRNIYAENLGTAHCKFVEAEQVSPALLPGGVSPVTITGIDFIKAGEVKAYRVNWEATEDVPEGFVINVVWKACELRILDVTGVEVCEVPDVPATGDARLAPTKQNHSFTAKASVAGILLSGLFFGLALVIQPWESRTADNEKARLN